MARRIVVSWIAVLAVATVAVAQAQAEPVLSMKETTVVMAEAEAAGSVESTEVISGSDEAIKRAFDPSLESPTKFSEAEGRPPEPKEPPLALVVIHGHFQDRRASVPPGQAAPTGTVMSFVVNLQKERIAALSLNKITPQEQNVKVERNEEAKLAFISHHVMGVLTASKYKPKAKAHVATWGNNCNPAGHCYDVSYWPMAGAEEVYGAYAEQDTSYMDVPEGATNWYFVNNEEWAYNPVVPNTWTEIGQTGGRYKGCCGIWWFWAFQNGTEGYKQFIEAPYVWEVGTGDHWYAMDTDGGGRWCWYYGRDQELVAGCETDFAWQATVLETGAEVATESKPVFQASVNNSAEWTNYTWHTWNDFDMSITTPGLCWASLNGAPGNIYYDTCSKDEET